MQSLDFSTAQTIATRIADHSRSSNISLYSEAQERGLTFSELLEELDPSPRTPDGKIDAPLDAFQRQLYLANIITHGSKSSTLAQVITGPGLILLPELITREITRGYQMVQDPTDLLAAVVPAAGPTVKPIYIKTAEAKKTLGRREQAAAFPVSRLLYREKEVAIQDRGRQFDFSYQILRNQRLPEFTVFLLWMGAQLAYDELGEIYTILLNGDGTSPAATDVFAGTPATWAYTDLVTLALSFTGPCKMTHLLGLSADIEVTLNLTEFKDAMAWRATELFARTGDYQSFLPLHTKLVIVPGATATKLIGMDSRFAIKESVASPLMVEAEKIITQKLETAVVSKEACYSVMVDDARFLSDY